MQVLAFSDLHLDDKAADAIIAAAAQADLVIGAGDFAQIHRGLDDFMARLAPLEDKAIYVVGNHETLEALRAATKAIILHGEAMVWQGKVIAGLGAAVPPLPPLSWGSYDLTEDAAAQLLSGLPQVDVLVTHAPPYGVGDVHATLGHIGSTAIRDAAVRLRPDWLFCGHIHDDWGANGMIGPTRVHNLGPTVNWFEV